MRLLSLPIVFFGFASAALGSPCAVNVLAARRMLAPEDESIAQYVCPEGASLSGTNCIETRIVPAVETRFPYTVPYPPAAQCEEVSRGEDSHDVKQTRIGGPLCWSVLDYLTDCAHLPGCVQDWSFHPPAGSCLNTTEEVVSDADLSDFATADPTWTCESAPEVPVEPEETCERTEYSISYSCPPGASMGPDGCYITTFFPATRVEPSTSTTPAPEVPEY